MFERNIAWYWLLSLLLRLGYLFYLLFGWFGMLVCDWLYSVWQNHYYLMLLHNQGCRLFQSLHFRKVVQDVKRRFRVDSNSEKSDPKIPFGRPSHASGRPSVSRKFEQFKVASIRTSWQHVRTNIRVRQEIRFSSQTRIWEDSCIRPDVKATPSGRGP
jgi:hypothetical protein